VYYNNILIHNNELNNLRSSNSFETKTVVSEFPQNRIPKILICKNKTVDDNNYKYNISTSIHYVHRPTTDVYRTMYFA